MLTVHIQQDVAEALKIRRRSINVLFDEVARITGKREYQIFCEVNELPNLTRFLRDVSTCAPHLLIYCQELLRSYERQKTAP